MKLLLVGGTGVISSGTAALANKRGVELFVLNRGRRGAVPGAHALTADYRDAAATKRVLAPHAFDAVIDFLTFLPAEMRQAIALFSGKTKQYIFISSATVYEKPMHGPSITEDAPLGNANSLYARNKLACETILREAVLEGFPGTVVRPSLTYADFNPLMALNSRAAPYAILDRMRRGKPVVVHGDGNSLWTITHTDDFAKGLLGLAGNPRAVGEAFHITSDEVLDWNRIYTLLAHAAGVEANLVHIPSDYISHVLPKLHDGLVGDHACSVVFDNKKIKSFVPDFVCDIPFSEGAKRCVAWFDEDPAARALLDPVWDAEMDALVAAYQRAYA